MALSWRLVETGSDKHLIEIYSPLVGESDHCFQLTPFQAQNLREGLSDVLKRLKYPEPPRQIVGMTVTDWREIYDALLDKRRALAEGEFDLVEPESYLRGRWLKRLDTLIRKIGVDGKIALWHGTQAATFELPEDIRRTTTAEGRERRGGPEPENAGRRWSESEDSRLCNNFDKGVKIQELAAQHGRSESAILARLVKLGKIPAERVVIQWGRRPGS